MQAAEFFAGMGLMRAGMEPCGIETVWANDVDQTKARLYRENWGTGELKVGDVRDIRGRDVPQVDIATASFPCVDLSLAGYRAGLRGERSGLVWEFCRIIGEMRKPPNVLLIENVRGFLSANGGKDFAQVSERLRCLGYSVGHVCVDAAAFVPQQRLRVFMVCFRDLSTMLPEPPKPNADLCLTQVVIDDGDWWGARKLAGFLSSLSEIQADRVDAYQRQPGDRHYGAYRRTRKGAAVWEVRKDELAGTLRTTQGGSSRQAVVRAGRGNVAVRWMDVREYAALQGAAGMRYDSVSPRQAMYAFGDAVCVPVVGWVAKSCILLPLESARSVANAKVAVGTNG